MIDEHNEDEEELITDIDSDANMLVVGKHATILSCTVNKVDVSPFTPDY